MNKKNKSILIILLVLCIGLVGLTIAYFSNSTSIENEFNTNPYGTTVTEEFVSPDNWLPGTTTHKTLTVTNSGLVDEAVRISYEESWTSANSTEVGDLALTQNNNRAAIINWVNTDDWTIVTEDEKTYKYYNYKLSPSSTTSELLESVTFNKDIVNSSNCVTTKSNGVETITCNSKGDGYDGATYKLTFRVETVQYDKYKAWGTSINIASMKPMNARDLALKSNPISVTNYTDGNIHEMYTFNHEATEQTPALIDYRYIGDDPYNYVYFNCDSETNQNSDTCEVWRIIGLFDVERPDPNDNTQTITERRMKLVRENAFEETMAWNEIRPDYRSSNKWEESSVSHFLNDEFYNKSGISENFGLKLIAQNMILETKYYLGSGEYNSQVYYGSAEEIYTWERNENVFNPELSNWCDYSVQDIGRCSLRNISWIGKIALLYPSDVYMVYGKHVNDICYNNSYNCYTYVGGEPSSGWIYNSNKLENQNITNNAWLISSYIDGYQAFDMRNYGALSYYDVDSSRAVRPVLYLSSSVKIIDGTGQENDPYKLSL